MGGPAGASSCPRSQSSATLLLVFSLQTRMEPHADAVLVQVWNTDTLSPVFMLFFSFHGLTLHDSQFSIFIHLKQPGYDK